MLPDLCVVTMRTGRLGPIQRSALRRAAMTSLPGDGGIDGTDRHDGARGPQRAGFGFTRSGR